MVPWLTAAQAGRGRERQALTRALLHHFFLTHVLHVHRAVHDELRGRAVIVQLELLTLVALNLQRRACGTDVAGFRSSPCQDPRDTRTGPSPAHPAWVLWAAGFPSEADVAAAGRGRPGAQSPGGEVEVCALHLAPSSSPGLPARKLQGGVCNPRDPIAPETSVSSRLR